MLRLAARTGGSLLLLLAAGSIAGCGDRPERRQVRLDITAPADAAVVREDGVEVRGRVRPARARVLVLGRSATVADGEFRARVPVHEGSNVIDVGGSARGATPGWSAVRVTRQVLVTVPDLDGASRQDAVTRLREAGLRADVEEADGLLDQLLGGDWFVCLARPPAGSRLARGAVVRLEVSRTC
jgi:Glucodextranase, domain B/PASTA domain